MTTRYEPGDNVDVIRNQGKREAVVLAVIGDEVLIEYTMPKGTTALNTTTHVALNMGGGYKAVSYASISTRWLKAIVEAGLEWVGYDQRNHRVVKVSRRGQEPWYDVKPCGGVPTPTPLQMLEQRLGVGLVGGSR